MRRQMLVRITQATCTLLLQVRHWRGPRYRVLPGSARFPIPQGGVGRRLRLGRLDERGLTFYGAPWTVPDGGN
jgi:hypothetical protein